MDNTKIELIKFNQTSGSVVKIGDEVFNYDDGCAIFRLEYSCFDNNNDILDDFKRKGFIYVYDFFSDSNIELNIFNVNKQKEFEGVDFAGLIKPINREEVSESFTYTISFQFKGKQISEFYPQSWDMKIIDESIITFKTFDGNVRGEYGNYGPEADELFGPRHKTQNGHMSDAGRYPWEYRIHISEIEKIFLTKKFRDVEQIVSDDEYQNNGKKEILELDLRSPDMEVYEKIIEIENCIEIKW